MDLRPNLRSKLDLLQTGFSVPMPCEKPCGTLSPLLFNNNLNSFKVGHGKEKLPVKASLFNKTLAITIVENATEPAMFSQDELVRYSSTKKMTKKKNHKKFKKEISPRKTQKLLDKRKKMKAIPTTKVGKSCKQKGKKSKKMEKAQLEIATTNVNELVIKDYEFKTQQKLIMAKKLENESKGIFLNTKLVNFNEMQVKKEKLQKMKQQLINQISISLFYAPKLDDVGNSTRISLMRLMKEMSQHDPEFILKMALYTRKILNVRVVSTFMISFAAYLPECRPFLKKYFNASIVLPSDWITVAEFYQTFFDKSMAFGSLPTSLRKAMIEKFPDFDEYQLAKYNKEKSQNKTKTGSYYPSEYDFLLDNEEEDGDFGPVAYELKSLSLKRLIRKLHISQPAQYIMALVGKKYPASLQEFYQSRLPGNFEEELAGKRMKLKTPETWETQVSLKGNKAMTWQDLLDHKKLPFMAMLRNLRNMINSGMAERYHNMIIQRLTDEKSVINSKQFPFRFLSAYDIIIVLENALATAGADDKPKLYNQTLLTRYKKAIEKSLKISTIHNISPISGMTIILVADVDSSWREALTKSTSSVVRTVLDSSLLLAVMCNFHCEESMLIMNVQKGFEVVDSLTDPKNLLKSVHELKDKAEEMRSNFKQDEARYGCKSVEEYLCQFIGSRRMIDNIYVLGGNLGENSFPIRNFINVYRKEVNPAMLVITQNMSDHASVGRIDEDNEVYLGGYSDQILKYLGERVNGRQLTSVENVDKIFNLKDVQVRRSKKASAEVTEVKIERPLLAWRTIRVFISSTFRDMHGERDLLTKYVFPELRCWCYNYCLNLYEVDLRWGITENQSQSEKQLELCLSEVMKADLFIGILGERLGWVPSSYKVDDQKGLEWLNEMPEGCSMTELEMRGFLRSGKKNSKALFLSRDPSFMSEIPEELKHDFGTQDQDGAKRLQKLKIFISKQKNVRLVENYPCCFGGQVTAGLEEFGKAVLSNVWETIKDNYINVEGKDETEVSVTPSVKHHTFAKELAEKFVGRKALLNKVTEILKDNSSTKSAKNIIMVSGKSGSGKTAFMAKLVQTYTETSNGACYFSETGPEFQSIPTMMRCLFQNINDEFNLGMVLSENDRELKVQFENLLKATSKILRSWQKYCIFIDGLEMMDKGRFGNFLDWIPEVVPKGIYLVISCLENQSVAKLLSNHQQLIASIKIPALEHPDRASFVRNTLQQYGKGLDESPFNNQMRLLLSKKGAESPLYLKLACEELRLFGVYEKVSDYINSMAQTIPQLIEFTLKRIESVYGKSVVAVVFSLIYHSRQGLTEDEIYQTLNMFENVKNWDESDLHDTECFFQKDRIAQIIPRATFVCLCREMKVFLNEDLNTGTITIIHRDIINVIHQHYVANEKHSSLVHFVLACFFCKQVDPNNDLSWQGKDLKALTELPYHMASSGLLWDVLLEMLTSVYFMKAKVENGLTLQYLEDLQMNIPVTNYKWLAKQFLEDDAIKDITLFIAKNLDVLGDYPKLLPQMAVNSPEGSYMHEISSSIPSDDVGSVIEWMNKPSETSTCSLTISTIKSPIQSISLSNDRNHVACGTIEGDVFVYDKETSKEIISFSGHTGAITACCYAGHKLCSASTDASISVWDVDTGNRLHVLKKHKEPITGCAATKDGKTLVSVSLDKTAMLWNLTDGKEAGRLTDIDCPLNCVALDTEEKHAAIGGWNKLIVIWNILENKKVLTYKGHKSSVRALAYSPNGRHLASSGLDGELLLWSTQNGAKIGQMSVLSHHIRHISFSSDGLKLFGASSDTSIKIWSGTLGCPEETILPSDSNSSIAQNDYALCVAVCDSLVAVGYNSGNVSVFENADKRTLLHSWKAHDSSVRSLCFLKSDSVYKKDLITASDDCNVKQWGYSKGKGKQPQWRLIRTLEGHSNGVTCVRAKEAFVITSSKDSSVRVWKAMLLVWDGVNDNETEPDSVSILHGHTGIVTSCDLSPCETKAISCGYDRALFIWDLTNSTALCVIHNAHADGITTCCWSDVGTYVVTGSNDFKLKLWNTKVLIQNAGNPEKLKERSVFIGHETTINDVRYKFGSVVSASADGKVKVWSQNGVEITSFQSHKDRINSCDLWAPGLSQDEEDQGKDWADQGKDLTSIQQRVRAKTPKNLNDIQLFTCSDDGKVNCWRPFKPHLLNVMYGHSRDVCQVYEGKPNEVISCSFDETIKVWDSMLEKQSELLSHSGEVSCIAYLERFQNNLRLVATGGRDGYIHLYKDFEHFQTFQTSNKDPVTALEISDDTDEILCGSSDGRVELFRFQIGLEMTSEVVKGEERFVKKHCPVLGITVLDEYCMVSYPGELLVFKMNLSSFLLVEVNSRARKSDVTVYPRKMNSIVDMKFYGNDVILAESHRNYLIMPKETLLCEFRKVSEAHKLYQSLTCIARSSINDFAIESDSTIHVLVGHNRNTMLIGHADGFITRVKLSYIDDDGNTNEEDDYKGEGFNFNETYWVKSEEERHKLHNGAVTGIFIHNDVMVTSSSDATIKVWSYPELQQIGLFTCRSSVVSMVGFYRPGYGGSIHLYVGDRIGNVEFLELSY